MSAGSRRRRVEEPEEHENHERWLVTYADMVTLLMVLFIVMFSMSVVDERKFNALKAGLAAGFGESTSVMTGSESILEQPGTASIAPVRAANFPGSSPRDQRAERALAAQEARYADARAELARLDELGDQLARALRRAGLADDVTRTIDDRGLVLSLTSRHVVFEPDRAELSGRGRRVLEAVAPVLRASTEDLRIDGHTNQVPVKPRYFATDWDLSSARAVTVLRYLQEVGGLPGERLSAAAFGHEDPLVDPARPGSQRVNKRVDLVVLSALPASARELLDDVAATPDPTTGGSS
ncbi:flagellar motor protein MotB [Nocardioides sp. zg-1228]|uniref:OmpA/MotB family protein n=1 Tax=Nocardioides sp. zg-1228 TaxID=2763008 RepID=UPI001642892A|nr:flagellar motor protein MotB [Nocardioides sp. zg-1228]MBC2932336.1 flagellar motor protein MotB [Nocardioides sp. zg-1228]QSF57852.1 flagellar motor protein MotB [Nocardioides sp. zg-1228]